MNLIEFGDFAGGPAARSHVPKAGALGLIPGWELVITCHKSLHATMKMLHAATET